MNSYVRALLVDYPTVTRGDPLTYPNLQLFRTTAVLCLEHYL